jgi:type I restriction enzyme R subunit
MSSHELPAVLQLKPIISYPREAQVGKTYLVSIDVQLATPNASWDFPEEEYTIGFILNTSPYFTCEPLHDVWPTIILHRYGGTYGPAEFLFTAAEHEIERGQISITLVNGWGIPMARLELPCEVKVESNLWDIMPEVTLPASQDTVINHDELPLIQVSPAELEEQERIDRIAAMLTESGWIVVDMIGAAGPTTTYTAIRVYPHGGGIEFDDGSLEYHDIDFILFVNGEAVGLLEREEVERFSSVATLVDVLINRSKNPFWSSLNPSVRDPLPFVYVMQSEEIHFTNNLEPEARTRTIFHLHRPETFALWLEQAPVGTPNDLNDLLRSRLRRMPPVSETNLSSSQLEAITKLEDSFAQNRPRALLQIANSSAIIINSVYRLLRYGGSRRILYLVNSKSIGVDVLRELEHYLIPGTSQSFLEVYKVCASDHPDPSSNIYIMTIEEVYHLLSPTDSGANNSDNDVSLADLSFTYQPELPIEFFDVIFFVECFDDLNRRYRPLLDYFDALWVGVGDDIPVRVETLFNRNIVYKLRKRIFICYSGEDREYLEKLQIHLISYARLVSKLSAIDIWDDTKIQAGTVWREEIEKSLQLTRVAILLVSADFLASNFIREFELPLLLQEARQREVSIIPVIVRPCLLTYTPLAQFQSFNNPSTPLAAMEPVQQEETWRKIARAVLSEMGIVPLQVEEVQDKFSETSQQTVSEDTTDITRHRICISYSHEDKAYLERLQAHLMGYRYVSSTSLDVDIWDDTKIQQEPDWHEGIEKSLQLTRVAILLVSANFLASDFIWEIEMPLLLKASSQGEIIVIPIIVRPCLFEETPLASFQSFNNPAIPVAAMSQVQQEETWGNVAEVIWRATDIKNNSREEKGIEVDEHAWETIIRDMADTTRHRIFISYSYQDKTYFERLYTHLMSYGYASSIPLDIDIWDDTKIQQEPDRHEEIEKSLQATKVAILLVSADFLASDYIRKVEMPLLLKATMQGNITILPVLIKPSVYTRTSLAQFQPFNNPTTPLAAMLPIQQEETWSYVAEVAWKAINT